MLPDDALLVELLFRGASAKWLSPADIETLLDRAEYHGLSGVVRDQLAVAGVVVSQPRVALREVARELDHAAHLAELQRIDQRFAKEGLSAALLKGALFAERFYPRPAARVTGDIDLLIREVDIQRASRTLETLGYLAAVGPDEDRYRREHHHLHFGHPNGLPLELHFHAYRGFGGIMRSEPLIARSLPAPSLHALRVLAPADEIVYLAVHGAAHKFGRWSWLFDLRLLLEHGDPSAIRVARKRAVELGFAQPLALAARLLVEIVGANSALVAPLGELDAIRSTIIVRVMDTPAHPIVRAASRLVYTTALCPDIRTSARWIRSELIRRGRSILMRA